jgi:MFS superfamily sulfate permease-like transporter
VVVVVGVEQAIIVAIALSLISHARRGYSPHNSVLVQTPAGFWHPVPVEQGGGQAAPGLVIYRFSHGLYYANAQKLQDEVPELTKPSCVATRWLCVDGVAIDDVDFTGGATLVSISNTLRERNTRLLFAGVSDHVRGELDRSGVTDLVGTDAYFEDLEQVKRQFEHGAAPEQDADTTQSSH